MDNGCLFGITLSEKIEMILNILHLTDSHIYSDPSNTLYGANTNQGLTDVVGAICRSEQRFDLAVITGDLVHDEGEAAYEALKQQLAPLNMPCYVIPGNHDRPEVMSQIFNDGSVRWQGSLILQGWQLLFVNTFAEDEIGGRISEQEYCRLEAVLGKSTLPSIIFMHHPALSVNSAWLDRIGLQAPQRFLSFVEKFPQIKAVVNGHIHQEFEHIDEQGVRFYGTPSTCAQFKPLAEAFAVDDAAPGWREIQLTNNGEVFSYIKRV